MGSLWSSENDRLAALEARIHALESTSNTPLRPRATSTPAPARPKPAWHATLMRELEKRRESIK